MLDERLHHWNSELDRRGSDRSLGDVSFVVCIVHEHMFARGRRLVGADWAEGSAQGMRIQTCWDSPRTSGLEDPAR